MEPLINYITGLGWIAVLCVIYAESGLLIGFFLPGDSLLFTAGFLVQQGTFDISVHSFFVMLMIAASLGQSTGYLFGKRFGRQLFERKNTRFFRKENLVRAELFYEKHGPITIILACFIPFIRTFVPIVAGISKMRYRQFIIYNIIGATLWTGSFTYLGYYAGQVLRSLGVNIEVAAIIIILLSISPMILHLLRDKDRRKAIIAGTKRELRTVFSKKSFK